MPVTRIKSDLLGVDFKVRSDGELNSRDYFDILKEVGPDGQQIVSPQDLLHVYKSAPYDERRQKLAINALDNGFFESEGSFTEAMTHMGASVGRGLGKIPVGNVLSKSLEKVRSEYDSADPTQYGAKWDEPVQKAALQFSGYAQTVPGQVFEPHKFWTDMFGETDTGAGMKKELGRALKFAGLPDDANMRRRVMDRVLDLDEYTTEATLAQAGVEATGMAAMIGAKGKEVFKKSEIGYRHSDSKEFKLAEIEHLAEQFDIADKIERGAELGLAQGGALATLVKVYTGLDPNFNVNEKALADVQAGVVQPDRDVAMAASFAMMPDMWASMGAAAGVNLGLRSISRGAILKAAQAASEESAFKATIAQLKSAGEVSVAGTRADVALSELNAKLLASAEQKLAKVAGSQEHLNKLVAKSEGIAQSLSAKLASAGQGESSQAARLLQAIEKAPDPKAPLINRAVGKALQGTGYTVEQVGRAGELIRRLPEETLTTLFMRSGGMDEASARAIARTVQVAVAAGTLTGGFQDLDPNLLELATALLLTPGGPAMITRLGHDVGILGKQLQFAQASSPLFQRIAQLEPPEASFVEASLDRTAAMTLQETVGGLAQKIFSPTRQFGPSVALKAPSTFLSRTGLGNTLTGAVNTAKTAAGAAAIPGAFGYALGGEEGAGGAIGASWPFIAAGMTAGTLMRFGSMADVHAKMLGDRAVYKETLSPVDLVEFQSYTKPVQQALATTAVQNPDVIVNFKKGKKSSYYAQENGESVITLYDGSTAAEQLSAVLGHEIAHHIDTFGFMPYVIEELLGSVEKKKPGVYTEYGKDGKPIVIKDEAGNNVYATNDEFAIRRKQYLDRLEPGTEAYNRYANNDALIAREVFASHGAAWYFGGEFVKKNWQGAGSKMMGAILDPIFGSNGMRKFLHRIGIPTNEGTKLVADPTYGGKGLMPGLKEVPALVRMIEKYNADVRGYGAEARRQGRGRGNLVDPAFKDEVASVSLTAKDLENPAIVERLKAGGHVKIADDGSIEVDASGRPVFLPTREVNKNNKQLSNDILDIIQKKEDAGETFGEGHVAMVETADGKPRATGRFLDPSIIAELRKQNRYNQHQLDALARINATLRNDTGDVWNLFYYSALKYNKAGRKVYGQIKGGDRPSLPFGIEITKDGNVIISTISLDAIQKNLEWFAKSKGYRQKMFDEFGGNNANEIVRNALSRLPQYLENHRKGKTDPAFENGKPASGISEGQRDLLNAAIGKINAEQVKRNPILEGLGDRRSNRQQSYRSRRLDRIGNAVRGEDGYYASASRIERNLQPMRMPRRKPNQPDDTIPLPFDELPGDKPGEGFGRMVNVDKTKAEMAEAKRLADEAQSGFSSSGNVRSKDAYGRDKLFMPASEAGAPKGKEKWSAELWREKGTDSPFFRRWFGRSKTLEYQRTGKTPLPWIHHGSLGQGGPESMTPTGSIWLSRPDPPGLVGRVPTGHADRGPMTQLYARANKIWDWRDNAHLNDLAKRISAEAEKNNFKWDAENWKEIVRDERGSAAHLNDFVSDIKALGFDAAQIGHNGELVIFDAAKNVKSADNRGTFSPAEGNILFMPAESKGQQKKILLRTKQEISDAVDSLAAERGISRNDALNELLNSALLDPKRPEGKRSEGDITLALTPEEIALLEKTEIGPNESAKYKAAIAKKREISEREIGVKNKLFMPANSPEQRRASKFGKDFSKSVGSDKEFLKKARADWMDKGFASPLFQQWMAESGEPAFARVREDGIVEPIKLFYAGKLGVGKAERNVAKIGQRGKVTRRGEYVPEIPVKLLENRDAAKAAQGEKKPLEVATNAAHVFDPDNPGHVSAYRDGISNYLDSLAMWMEGQVGFEADLAAARRLRAELSSFADPVAMHEALETVLGDMIAERPEAVSAELPADVRAVEAGARADMENFRLQLMDEVPTFAGRLEALGWQGLKTGKGEITIFDPRRVKLIVDQAGEYAFFTKNRPFGTVAGTFGADMPSKRFSGYGDTGDLRFMPAAKLYGPVENIGGIRLKKDSRYGPTNTAVVGRGKAAEEHYMHGYSLPDEVAAEAIKKHNDYGAGRLLHYVADGDFETKAPKSLKAWTDIQKRLTAEIQRERNVAKNAAQESKEFLAKYGKSADNLLSWRSDATRQYGTDYDGLVYRGEKSDKAANIKKDGIKTKWEEPSNISKSIYPLLKIELENGTSFYEQVRISDHDQVSANAPRYYEYDYRAKDFMEAFPKIEEDMQGLAWDMWAEQKEYLEGLK